MAGLFVSLGSNGVQADDSRTDTPQQAERQPGVAGMEVIDDGNGNMVIVETPRILQKGMGEIAGSSSVTDYDGDGCSDLAEINLNPKKGGKRDSVNPYDYLNPTGDGLNRVDDILAVVGQYFHDDPVGQTDWNSTTDRTGILGGQAWNLGPPNGIQRVDDILAAVKHYFHDCNPNVSVVPDGVQFTTGATTADEIEELVTVDLAPFLVSLAAAGEGGVSGIVAGQEASGFQVVCTHSDGGFVVAPLAYSEPTVIPAQESGSDLFSGGVETAPACSSSVAGFNDDDCRGWSSLYRPAGIASVVVPPSGGYSWDAKTKCDDDASVISVVSIFIRIQYDTPNIEGIIGTDLDWLDDDAEVAGNGLAVNRSGACYVVISAHGAFHFNPINGRRQAYNSASFSPVRCVP